MNGNLPAAGAGKPAPPVSRATCVGAGRETLQTVARAESGLAPCIHVRLQRRLSSSGVGLQGARRKRLRDLATVG